MNFTVSSEVSFSSLLFHLMQFSVIHRCILSQITDVENDATTCYFWHEALANRGAIEIGSCVHKFLEDISNKHPNCDVIFYSDNCCGQQKNRFQYTFHSLLRFCICAINIGYELIFILTLLSLSVFVDRFMFSMYYYATSKLPIQSITQKFLIHGHTQNEDDNAHSIIEKAVKRAKKSGPIYIPDQYAQIIRTAKKSDHPYKVVEMNFDEFYELKALADEVRLNMAKNVNGVPVKTTDIKIIRFSKDCDTYAYKTFYNEEWIETETNKKARGSHNLNTNEIKSLQQAYTSKIVIKGRLKTDLISLINSNIVPSMILRGSL